MLLLPEEDRDALWRQVTAAIESYVVGVGEESASPPMDPSAVRSRLAPLDFGEPLDPSQAIELVVDGLLRYQVHTPHPRYFGLYNPAPTTMSIAADALVAAFNPQLAAWSHSPFAVEVENHLVRALGEQFGYDPQTCRGVFATGGAEANHTALLTALCRAFPTFTGEGIRAAPGRPTLYISSEGHHSFHKAARLSGLGTRSVREVPVASDLRMDSDALLELLRKDRARGDHPFLLVGTAGTTSAGTVDPLPRLAEVARTEGLWFHADAAWGGAAILVPELKPALAGIESADSITVDAHKLLSVSMGAGLYLTRHPEILEKTFHVAAGYMPREALGLPVVDPYSISMQWSRRFIGLKLFLSLLVAGWKGYAEAIGHQAEMGDRLKEKLTASGWSIANDTLLPVVCFSDGTHPEGRSAERLSRVLNRVLGSGEAWISIAELPHWGSALRACITNYRTEPSDLDRLVTVLDRAREEA
jgi:glutamate/tyrosine decarboxylase-like PLP-dependent enzyme